VFLAKQGLLQGLGAYKRPKRQSLYKVFSPKKPKRRSFRRGAGAGEWEVVTYFSLSGWV
jgi:hypothetical protein